MEEQSTDKKGVVTLDKTHLVLIGVIVVLLGGFFFMQQKDTEESAVAQPEAATETSSESSTTADETAPDATDPEEDITYPEEKTDQAVYLDDLGTAGYDIDGVIFDKVGPDPHDPVSGVWIDQAVAPIAGDITGDGVQDAALFLAQQDEQGNVTYYTAIVTRHNGVLETSNAYFLGTNVDPQSLSIAPEALFVSYRYYEGDTEIVNVDKELTLIIDGLSLYEMDTTL